MNQPDHHDHDRERRRDHRRRDQRPGPDTRNNGDPLGRSDYQLNAEFGYCRARDLFARAAAEPDRLHQRRLLRDAESNLGWAQHNEQLEQARAVLDALETTDETTGELWRDVSNGDDDGDGNRAVPDPLEQARAAVEATDLTDIILDELADESRSDTARKNADRAAHDDRSC